MHQDIMVPLFVPASSTSSIKSCMSFRFPAVRLTQERLPTASASTNIAEDVAVDVGNTISHTVTSLMLQFHLCCVAIFPLAESRLLAR